MGTGLSLWSLLLAGDSPNEYAIIFPIELAQTRHTTHTNNQPQHKGATERSIMIVNKCGNMPQTDTNNHSLLFAVWNKSAILGNEINIG